MYKAPTTISPQRLLVKCLSARNGYENCRETEFIREREAIFPEREYNNFPTNGKIFAVCDAASIGMPTIK